MLEIKSTIPISILPVTIILFSFSILDNLENKQRLLNLLNSKVYLWGIYLL